MFDKDTFKIALSQATACESRQNKFNIITKMSYQVLILQKEH